MRPLSAYDDCSAGGLAIIHKLAPHIVNARATGGDLKFWHALGSAMYLGQWLCAGASLWMLAKPPSAV